MEKKFLENVFTRKNICERCHKGISLHLIPESQGKNEKVGRKSNYPRSLVFIYFPFAFPIFNLVGIKIVFSILSEKKTGKIGWNRHVLCVFNVPCSWSVLWGKGVPSHMSDYLLPQSPLQMGGLRWSQLGKPLMVSRLGQKCLHRAIGSFLVELQLSPGIRTLLFATLAPILASCCSHYLGVPMKMTGLKVSGRDSKCQMSSTGVWMRRRMTRNSFVSEFLCKGAKDI